MKKSQILSRVFLLSMGFAGMCLSGLNWHLTIAAWLTPLFILRFTRSTKTIGFLLFFIVSVIAGMISRTCFALVDLWIVHIINGLYFATMYSLPYLTDRLLYRKNRGFSSTLIFPSAVVFFEYMVSIQTGTWGATAHTQFNLLPFIQLGSVTGFYGVSFIVSWFGAIVNRIIEEEYNLQIIKKCAAIYAGVLLVTLFAGELRITFFSPKSETVKVAAITGNTDIFEIAANEFEALGSFTENKSKDIPERVFAGSEQIKEQIKKTEKAANCGAKIIAWSEISLILDTVQIDSLKAVISKIATEYQSYILMAYLEQADKSSPKPFNNKSVLITPSGQIAWEYAKSALHPQAEAPIINPGNFEIPFFDTEYGRLGNVICYDLDFPNFIRQAGKKKIDIMLVPSYDWEKITPLHAQMAAFEALQNGFSIVRPNGAGLSIAVDYQGNILSQLNTFKTSDKTMYANVPVKGTSTLYSKIGNGFVYLCILNLIVNIILIFTKRKK